jgi:hypothetical protein
MVRQTQDTWNEAFNLLSKFVERRGNALVPVSYTTWDGFKLGNWVSHQRASYKRGILSKERRKKLEELHGWVWDVKEARWWESLKNLYIYVDQYTTSLVPKRYIAKDGFALGNWVVAQRVAYKHGKLSQEQQQALTELPDWTWERRKTRKDRWREGFEYLRAYVKLTGHARVPVSYITMDGYALGNWISQQRMAYRDGKLLPGWQQLLEGLPGWKWSIKDKIWHEGYMHLRDYVQRKRHACVPLNYVTEDSFDLGLWILRQRKAYKKGSLSKWKIQALEQLPGWGWDKHKAEWSKGFELLREHVRHIGNAQVHLSYRTKSGYNLGFWIDSQREAYKKGKLTAEQQEVLEKLQGWTWECEIRH